MEGGVFLSHLANPNGQFETILTLNKTKER